MKGKKGSLDLHFSTSLKKKSNFKFIKSIPLRLKSEILDVYLLAKSNKGAGHVSTEGYESAGPGLSLSLIVGVGLVGTCHQLATHSMCVNLQRGPDLVL
jgi:hypothetical protein